MNGETDFHAPRVSSSKTYTKWKHENLERGHGLARHFDCFCLIYAKRKTILVPSSSSKSKFSSLWIQSDSLAQWTPKDYFLHTNFFYETVQNQVRPDIQVYKLICSLDSSKGHRYNKPLEGTPFRPQNPYANSQKNRRWCVLRVSTANILPLKDLDKQRKTWIARLIDFPAYKLEQAGSREDMGKWSWVRKPTPKRRRRRARSRGDKKSTKEQHRSSSRGRVAERFKSVPLPPFLP